MGDRRQQLRAAAVSSANSAVREDAISDLAGLRHPDDLEFLLDRFRDDDVQDVAQESVEQEWGRAAVPALIARLPGCDDDCLCLIEALEHVGDASALGPLADKLGDADQGTAEWAARAIAEIAEREGARPQAIALLERGREASANPYVREVVDALIRDLRDASR